MELNTKFLLLCLGKVLQSRDGQWDVLVKVVNFEFEFEFAEFCCIKKYLEDVTEAFFFFFLLTFTLVR